MKQKVIIPKWIKEIPTRAFANNSNIEEVDIPETVHLIEKDAFMNCNSLEKVYFYGNVKTISSTAFPNKNRINFFFAKSISEKDRECMSVSIGRSGFCKKSQNLMDEVIPKKDVDKRILKDSEKKTDIQTEDTSILTNGLTTNSNLNDLIKDSTSENDNDLLGENEKKETNTAQIVKDYTLCDDTICSSEEVKIKSDLCVTEDTIQTESIDSESISPEITENEAITEVEIEKSDDILYESINKRIIEDEPVNVPDKLINTEQIQRSENKNELTKAETDVKATINASDSIVEVKQDVVKTSESIESNDEIEVYDEVIPPKHSRHVSAQNTSIVGTKKKASDNKDDIRQRDLKKYASKTLVSDIESSDLFVSSLIEKYASLENKYGYKVPLGMIDMTKAEYEKLTGYVHGFITTEAPIVSLTAFLCSIFLVKTVANYDHNNNFWGAVSALLKYDENSATRYLKEALLCFCSSEKLYFHYYGNRHSYARTVLIHSIINRSTLNAVIDFIRDFYIEEMCESYDSNSVQSYIDIFVDEMVKDLSKISDDNSSGSDMGGIYKVSLAFKTACREFPDAVKDGMKCLLFNIDAYYHRTSDVSYSPAVFNKYFKRWKINDVIQKRMNVSEQGKKQTNLSIKSDKKNNQQLERLARLQRCVYYIDEDYRLNLYIPQQNIPSEYAENSVHIRLFNNDEALLEYNQELDVFGMFRFHTGEILIELKNFYKNLSIRIVTESEEVIFDSKSQLYRNYIVFDANLDEYTGRTIPKERFYVLSEKNDEFFADANYNTYKYSDYAVHSLDTDGDCEILVGKHSVFDSFDSSADIQLHIDKSFLIKRVKAYATGKEYRVYSSLPQIRCKIENDNADKYILDVNDAHINADEIFGEIHEAVLNLEKIFNTDKLNFINICLREKGNKKSIYEWRIAVLKNFEYSLDKAYYYTDNTVQLLDLYASNAEFEIEDYPYNFAVNSSRKITVNSICDSIAFYIDIKLPMIYWEFDEEYNSLRGTKYISSEVFEKNSNVIMELPAGSFSIWAINDITQRQLSVQSGKLNLSDFRVSGSDYTTIGLKGEKTGELKLFELIHKPSVRELYVVCDGNELTVSYIQIGKCMIDISLTNKDGDKVFSKIISPQSNGEMIITENISELENGIYSVEVSQLIADDFGFAVTRKMIGTYAITKGNAFEVYCQSKNGMLKPHYCVFDGEIKKRANNFYCENIKSNDNGESGIYTANAFYNNRNGDRVYFEDANPLRIELLEKNNNIITFTIADNDGDGLIYENARGYLCSDKEGTRDSKAYSLPDHYVIKI